MERLDKLLSGTGRWSRKEARALVKAGRVRVDGAVAQAEDAKYPAEAKVSVDGEAVCCVQLVYLMLHKPAGLISSTEDPREPTVLQLLPPHLQKIGLSPVGRLDKDTEGLLLLTNDGALAHRLLSPRHHVRKRYYVEVDGRLEPSDVEAFAAGLLLGDGLQCLPAGLEIGAPPSTGYVTLQEGKFHQIKRMLACRGKPVRYLKRLSMGQLTLDASLPVGAWRPLSDTEKAALNGSKKEEKVSALSTKNMHLPIEIDAANLYNGTKQ